MRLPFGCALGTFGQVLECWDREKNEMVAIKITRSVKKYRDDARIEINVLEQLGKYEKARSWYVPQSGTPIYLWFFFSFVCFVMD